jgi:hypothetical protein
LKLETAAIIVHFLCILYPLCETALNPKRLLALCAFESQLGFAAIDGFYSQPSRQGR